jgi:hypothetical protein
MGTFARVVAVQVTNLAENTSMDLYVYAERMRQ